MNEFKAELEKADNVSQANTQEAREQGEVRANNTEKNFDNITARLKNGHVNYTLLTTEDGRNLIKIENSKKELAECRAPVKKEIDIQRQKKSEMKQKFKSGKLSEDEYSKVCKHLKRLKDSLNTVDWRFYDDLQKKYKISLSGIQELIFN